MDDGVITATLRDIIRDRQRSEGVTYLWDALHNGYTEREKLHYGIVHGIPLNIPKLLYLERRVMLLEMEQEYRESGRGILAQWCREEIARHDGMHGLTQVAP
jgi:hypothetical protein